MKYFGTDGIRGRVGTHPITPDFMLQVGHAVGSVLQQGHRKTVVIGKDTRLSGYMFESALEAGIAAAGANIALLGPMPTPAIAYLTRTMGACAGIVISASHNAYHDNGIKLVGGDGFKLSDSKQEAIEAHLQELQQAAHLPMPEPDNIGKAKRIDDAAGRYIEYCKASFSRKYDLHGLKIVIDCANGAAYQVAPRVFRELGAEVIALHNQPDGLNINVECGSTRPELMQAAVLEHSADIGIALDGDGDRCIMADHHGQLVNGDGMLYVLAKSRLRRRKLGNDVRGKVQGVVGTLMTNYALEKVLGEREVPFIRAAVGDRYVHQQLKQHGWRLGGETSGHILCLDKADFGDGIITALQVLEALVANHESLHAALSDLQLLPQSMINVQLNGKAWSDINRVSAVTEVASDIEQQLFGMGRLVLRPSGTEPVVRVMVEHSDLQVGQQLASSLAQTIQKHATQ